MGRYEELKAKWTEMARGDYACNVYNLDLLKPGVFLMYISDETHDGLVEDTAFFDTVHDGLAFLRFLQVPETMAFDTKTYSEELMPDEVYLNKYADSKRAEIQGLLAELDTLLISIEIAPEDLGRVMEHYEAAFGHVSSICAWGSLIEVLKSPNLWETAEKCAAEGGRAERAVENMRALLESGRFKEKYDRHVRMAREFFEMVRVG